MIKKIGTFVLMFTFIFSVLIISVEHVDAYSLSVTNRKQEKTLWCWNASLQMVIEYTTGKLYSQNTISESIYGNTNNTARTSLTVNMGLNGYTGNRYLLDSPSGLPAYKTSINKGRPVILGLIKGFSGHMVVAKGYNTNGLQLGDPSNGQHTWVNYDVFRTGQDSWFKGYKIFDNIIGK